MGEYFPETERPVPPVLAASGPRDEAAFLDYINILRVAPAATIAAQESERLSYYFDALGKYLTQAKEDAPKSLFTWRRLFEGSKPKRSITEPGTLNKIFRFVAEATGNTILSEVSIVPASLLASPGISDLRDKKGIGGDAEKSRYGNADFTLGFIQCMKTKTLDFDYYPSFTFLESTVSFPVLALDDSMMEAISRCQPQKMLEALQTVMSACTHDTLHHFTNVYFNDIVSVKPAEAAYKAPLNEVIRKYSDRNSASDLMGFEMFLTGSHAAIWDKTRNAPERKHITDTLDAYFDELERISAELKPTDPELRNRAIDYFATAAGFGLIRIVPFDDPLMQNYLHRAESVTPDPDDIQSIEPGFSGIVTNEILQNYAAAGKTIAQSPYGFTKLIQLVNMLTWTAYTLSPAANSPDLQKAQQRLSPGNQKIFSTLNRFLPSEPA
jgi:hypothetical protein